MSDESFAYATTPLVYTIRRIQGNLRVMPSFAQNADC